MRKLILGRYQSPQILRSWVALAPIDWVVLVLGAKVVDEYYFCSTFSHF
jgi:hypothetical protein